MKLDTYGKVPLGYYVVFAVLVYVLARILM